MFEEILEKLSGALEARRISYMVIGGQAVLVHGEPRLTRDIDLTLGCDVDRVDDILQLSASLGWKALPENPKEFVREKMVLPVQDIESGVRIDFIFSFSPFEEEAIRRAKNINIGKAKVRFATVEDLIIHKMVAGRPRDLEDIKSVLLKNPQFDRAYLMRWLNEFEAGLGVQIVARFEDLLNSLRK